MRDAAPLGASGSPVRELACEPEGLLVAVQPRVVRVPVSLVQGVERSQQRPVVWHALNAGGGGPGGGGGGGPRLGEEEKRRVDVVRGGAAPERRSDQRLGRRPRLRHGRQEAWARGVLGGEQGEVEGGRSEGRLVASSVVLDPVAEEEGAGAGVGWRREEAGRVAEEVCLVVEEEDLVKVSGEDGERLAHEAAHRAELARRQRGMEGLAQVAHSSARRQEATAPGRVGFAQLADVPDLRGQCAARGAQPREHGQGLVEEARGRASEHASPPSPAAARDSAVFRRVREERRHVQPRAAQTAACAELTQRRRRVGGPGAGGGGEGRAGAAWGASRRVGRGEHLAAPKADPACSGQQLRVAAGRVLEPCGERAEGGVEAGPLETAQLELTRPRARTAGDGLQREHGLDGVRCPPRLDGKPRGQACCLETVEVCPRRGRAAEEAEPRCGGHRVEEALRSELVSRGGRRVGQLTEVARAERRVCPRRLRPTAVIEVARRDHLGRVADEVDNACAATGPASDVLRLELQHEMAKPAGDLAWRLPPRVLGDPPSG
mmetsp:Transcript_24578/g.82929  ORF Transcript_24578/g.82929 Transcript_24578/m.82929 type:complete len:548 (+) Transcript_24578:699-2342(+)